MGHVILEIGVTTKRGHSYRAVISVSHEKLYALHDKMIDGSTGDLFPRASTATYQDAQFWDTDKAILVIEAALSQSMRDNRLFRFTPYPRGGREMFDMKYAFSAYVREME